MRLLCKFQLLVVFYICSVELNAQVFNDEDVHYHHVANSSNFNAKIESTGNTGTGANINVVYHRCSWTADPDDATKTLTGTVTTYFKTLEASVNTLSFDFNKASFNNVNLSVTYHGQPCSFSFPASGNTDILQITLPSVIALSATLDSLTINYKGIPPAASGSKTGYQRTADKAGNFYIYTLSESYEDKDWWPCKADMQDKIDSLDILITVPQAFWVATNGVMTDSSISGANRIFKFKHRYPIASYLVSLGIAKYKKLYLGNLIAGNKNVPYIVNYFPDKTSTVETSIAGFLNNHKLVFAALSNLFGDYPFANEKHGFYEFADVGGMEHQTFSAVGSSALQGNSVLSHEFAHQWWGDKVTFSTWADLWLAEGFATYSESLAAEFVPSLGINLVNKIGNVKASARNNSSTSVSVTNITNSNTIWTSSNNTAIYNRGCMVASMLRALLGDTKFFAACRNYLADINAAYACANTALLQQHMENQFGESLVDFFSEWIYKKGTPNYTVQWGKNNKIIKIKLAQTVAATGTSGTASTFFPMPVVLKIADTTNGFDTTVVIYHKALQEIEYGGLGASAISNTDIAGYTLSFVPNKVSIDVQNKTMATGTVSYSALLPINKLQLHALQNNGINKILLSVNNINAADRVVLQEQDVNGSFIDLDIMQRNNSYFNEIIFEKSVAANSSTIKHYRAVVYSLTGVTYSNTIAIQPNNKVISIKIFPNPVKDNLSIITDGVNETCRITIKNVYGVFLKEFKSRNNNLILNLSNLPKGIYVADVEVNGKQTAIQKFVKL